MDAHALYDQILAQAPERRNFPFGAPIAIAPGGGNKTASEGRFAVDWQKYATEIWVSGTDYVNRPDEVRHTKEDLERLLERAGELPTILQQPKGLARHTPDQADWIARQAQVSGVKRLILSTTGYHLPRFALTVCASLHKLRINDIALAVVSTPQAEVVSNSTTSQSREEEIGRIPIYQEKGDVATYDVAKKYFFL